MILGRVPCPFSGQEIQHEFVCWSWLITVSRSCQNPWMMWTEAPKTRLPSSLSTQTALMTCVANGWTLCFAKSRTWKFHIFSMKFLWPMICIDMSWRFFYILDILVSKGKAILWAAELDNKTQRPATTRAGSYLPHVMRQKPLWCSSPQVSQVEFDDF